VSTTNEKKQMEFVNQDYNAAINIRRCAVLENRPAELMRENLCGVASGGRVVQGEVETSSRGLSKKHREASAHQSVEIYSLWQSVCHSPPHCTGYAAYAN
jgi:hypothetical protein